MADNNKKKNNNNNNDNGGGNNFRPLGYYLLTAVIFTLLINSLLDQFTKSALVSVTYNEFVTMVEKNEVETVEFDDDRILIQPKSNDAANISEQKIYYTGFIEDAKLLDLLEKHEVNFTAKTKDRTSPAMGFIMNWVLPFAFIYFLMSLFMGAMGKRSGMGFGQNTAKVYVQKETGVMFSDVAGQEEAKESLKEIIDFLNHPKKYDAIGAKLPKGALLVGPPGTGKTLLAKAVAGEANVPFFSLTGSDFVEMFVGVGASRVRDLFKQAVKSAPAIIFIDEIDAIGKRRDNAYGGNDEREQTLNQLLSEMDGFDSEKAVVILAATNRPEVLDKALLRPGRFDRRVIVDKPDLPGREAILRVHCKGIKLDDDVDLNGIAKATSGAVGADLANMVNEAALGAVRAGRERVAQKDLFEAVEVVIAGKEKKDRVLSQKEKRIVAFHEVGHALATALQKHSQPVHKITIVPRTMGALGYTMQMPEEEKFLMSKDEMLAEITTFLAGRAAEELEFGSVTTGASNDIDRATKMARSIVVNYGMSDRFDMMALETEGSRYLDQRGHLDCSDATAQAVDEEILKIIRNCHEKALDILKENMESLRRISEYLIEKESITGEEFMTRLKEQKGEEFFREYEREKNKEAGVEHKVGFWDMTPKQTAQDTEDEDVSDAPEEASERSRAVDEQKAAPVTEPTVEPVAEPVAEPTEEPKDEPER